MLRNITSNAGMLLVVLLLINSLHAETGSASIYTVFVKLRSDKRIELVGYDRVSQCVDTLADSSELRKAVANLDFVALSHIVENETDYECLTGKNYVILVPKDDPAKHDLTLSKRVVTIRPSDNLSIDELYKQINKDNPKVVLGTPLMGTSSIAGGSFSLKGGQCEVYELLNDMATQLKAKYWEIDRLEPFYHSGTPIEVLGVGSISFFKS